VGKKAGARTKTGMKGGKGGRTKKKLKSDTIRLEYYSREENKTTPVDRGKGEQKKE